MSGKSSLLATNPHGWMFDASGVDVLGAPFHGSPTEKTRAKTVFTQIG